MAYKGLVSEANVRSLSPMMNLLLMPSVMIASLGRGLSLEVFLDERSWMLPVIGVCTGWFFGILGIGLRYIARPQPAAARLFVVMQANPNLVAVPITLMESLCAMGVFSSEFSNTADCADRGRAMVILYAALDSVNTFVVAQSYLSGGDGAEGLKATVKDVTLEIRAAPPSSSTCSASGSSACGASMSSGNSGNGKGDELLQTAAVASVPAVTAAAKGDATFSHQPLCAIATRQLSSLFRRPPVVGMAVGLLVVRGALARCRLPFLHLPPIFFLSPSLSGTHTHTYTHTHTFSLFPILQGLVEPLRHILFGRDAALQVVGVAMSSLASACVPLLNLMVAFSLGHKLKGLASWRDLLGSFRSGFSPRTMAVCTLGRMVIVPAIDGLLLYSMRHVLPSSRLLRVLLYVEIATPTASVVVLLAHIAKKPALAELCAFAMLPQYILGAVSLTAAVAIALGVTQEVL